MAEEIDYLMWVLAVDDHANVRQLVSHTLIQIGFLNVDTSKDGLDALLKIEKKDYGLIISDLDMPPYHGMDLLKAIRAEPLTAHIPFIVLTSDNMSNSVKEALAAGANHYLVKPFTPETLRASILKGISQANTDTLS